MPEPTEAMVEAAAEAAARAQYGENGMTAWADIQTEDFKAAWRKIARAALVAAAPDYREEAEQLAEALEEITKHRARGGSVTSICELEPEVCRRVVMEIAEEALAAYRAALSSVGGVGS